MSGATLLNFGEQSVDALDRAVSPTLGRPQVQIIQQTVTPIDQSAKASAPAAAKKSPKNRSFFARILGK